MSITSKDPGLPVSRKARLKTFRRQARNETIGLPQRAYARKANGQIIAVRSTRARYLELKRGSKV